MSSTSLFGEHLRREREMRGVSLEEISAATRISVRFLEALENEQWERLPGGIFNRGFIRSIAKFLGLDEDGLIAEYALETRERPEIAVWTKEAVQPRPNWFGIVGTVVLIAAVIGGGWYGYRAYGERISAWHAKHPIFSTVMAKLRHKGVAADHASAAQGPAAAPQSSSNAGSSGNLAANQGVSAQQASSVRSPVVANGAKSTAANAKMQETSKSGSGVNSAGENSAITGTSNSNGAAAAADKNVLVLKVEAGETSTITVTADGKVVFSGELDALKTLTLHAQKSFTVSASKSNAVLLELNGRTVPPLGPPNEPGEITLTRDNLKTNPGDAY